MGLINPWEYSPNDLTRFLWLRATEWASWPAFLSQPLLPILYIFFPVWQVFVAVLLLGIPWRLIRYRVANVQLAIAGVFWAKVRWITAIGCSIYFLWQRHWVLAVLSLLTSIVGGMLGLTCAGANIGGLQRVFFVQLGFGDDNYRSAWERLYGVESPNPETNAQSDFVESTGVEE